jgi:hypothetical protein
LHCVHTLPSSSASQFMTDSDQSNVYFLTAKNHLRMVPARGATVRKLNMFWCYRCHQLTTSNRPQKSKDTALI